MTALTSSTTGVGDHVAVHTPAVAAQRSPWPRTLPPLVALADLGAGLVAVVAAVRLRYPGHVPGLRLGDDVEVGYGVVGAGVAAIWVGVLAAHGVYRSSQLAAVGQGLPQVARSGLVLFALLAVGHLLAGADTSGRLVVGVVGLAVLASVLVHLVVDRVIHEAYRRGRWRHRAVLCGPALRVQTLADRLDHDPGLGVDVVATCRLPHAVDAKEGGTNGNGHRGDGNGDQTDGHGPNGRSTDGNGTNGHGTDGSNRHGAWRGSGAPAAVDLREGGGPPVINLRDAESLREIVVESGADLVAVTGGTGSVRVRSLAWALEGTGVQLLVAPTVPGLVDRSVAVEPMAGVPLVRLSPCRLTGVRLAAKAVIDRVGAALLLMMLSPVLVVSALCVRLSGPGPVIFRQARVGQYGGTFEFLKFRTMVDGADRQTADLAADNESDGLLFKLRADPRVTRIGHWMRRLSLDELPQLWNVVRGDMSLVGPRPLPVAPESFHGAARRRLRVKPGITGLWQVSGRSELSWADTVRLDVRYVDRWSLGLDLMILLRTPGAVLLGRGAY